jgi:L-alanine-DL-glutamate epimerase-like enolase superfamily enzyme
MKIKSIEFEPVDFQLENTFSFGDFSLNCLEYVLVKVETEKGIIGLGEAPAYWDPNGETQESAMGALRLMSPKIEGMEVSQINKINQKWDRNCRRAFSARAAIDMALHDIQGKAYDVPVYKLLGGKAQEVRMPENISLSASLEEARDRIESTGNNLFKLKADDDIERLNKIAGFIQSEVENPTISVDVNQVWRTVGQANKNIKKLRFDPDWIEQPIDSGDINGLINVNATVMPDESFHSTSDMVVMRDKADMFNIKLAKAGGLSKATELAKMMSAENKRYIMGSMLESPIGSMSAYHFSKSNQPIWMEASGQSLIEGVNNVFEIKQGKVKANKKPGLGVKPRDLGKYYPF